MRRLINLLLPGLFICIFNNTSTAQVGVDTIDISKTILEDRHLRYMYNFALNGKFFQYRQIPDHIVTGGLMKNDRHNEIVFIVKDEFPIGINELELFVQPDSLLEVKFVSNSNHNIEKFSFTSQFDFEYLQLEGQKNKQDFIREKLNDNPEINYAIQFSNLYIRRNKIYLSVSMHYYVNYNPDAIFGGYQMYEFEWCESMGWVYPKRVSSDAFGLVISDKVQLDGTINIPSLECP